MDEIIKHTKFEAVALAVIRGEMPLTALSEIGVQVSCREDNCRLDSEVKEALATPSVVDVAQGLLTYRANRDELRLWAFFVLAESGGIDLAKIEAHPQGNVLIEALWDASSFGRVTKDAIKVAESLAITSH